MMKSKSEMRMEKLALAALLLGVFSLNPMARADEPVTKAAEQVAAATVDPDLPLVQAVGLSWAQLQAISPDFKVRIEGETLTFSGTMPAKCAVGRNMAVESSADTHEHAIMVDLPGCRGALTAQDQAKRVSVNLAFPAKAFDVGVDGKFCMKYSAAGDGIFACSPITIGGKPLEFISAKTRDDKARADQEAKDKLVRASELERSSKEDAKNWARLKERVDIACKQGNTQEVKDQLVAALGDIKELSQILAQVDKVGLANLKRAVEKAKDEDSLKEAFEAYKAAAEGLGVDTEDLIKVYAKRRTDLVEEKVKDTNVKPAEAASAIRDLIGDLKDNGVFEKEDKQKVAILYSQLATNLGNDGKLDQAEKYYNEAMKYTDDKGKIEGGMAKMYNDAAMACLEKNKANPKKCDKLADRANKHHGNMVAIMKKSGDEDWQEAAVEQIQMFGRSSALGLPNYAVNMGVLGRLSPYGGAYQQAKIEGMREAMMQKQYGMQPGMNTSASGESGGYSSVYSK